MAARAASLCAGAVSIWESNSCEQCEGQGRLALFFLFNQRDVLACRDCVAALKIDTFGTGFHRCHLM